MRLAEAVAIYVEARHRSGSPFRSGEITLRAFCRHCGEVNLAELTADHVSSFSNNPRCAPVTQAAKFSGVKCFLDYYNARGQISALSLRKPAKPHDIRGPFIYTRTEIASLLKCTERCQSKATEFDAKTFRLLILLLYATGATVQEIISLKWSSIDLRKRLILIDKSLLRAARTLPIGTDLVRYLARWRSLSHPNGHRGFVLCGKDGRTMSGVNLKDRFVHLRELAGLQKSADGRVPRLQDLRFTFAVHRLNYWIRRGDDLNRLLPALSTYMGYSSLTTAQQFLAYVPHRFKHDLQKLSPTKGRKRWSKDSELMGFLSSL